jgi:NitT/TauT family transport system substrate-binding protein
MSLSGCLKSAIVLAALNAGSAMPAARAADEPKPVRLLMTWFAQADQAGFWQAQLDGFGKDGGIRIAVQQGGPKIQTIPQVAAGQADFGLGNADDVLVARMRGAPIRAVFASLDYVPYTLVYHPSPAIKSIADLKQKAFAVSLGFAYWDWIKKQYDLTGVREMPVSGDLTLFKGDENLVQQGYSIYLPARMTEAGIPNAQFKVPDLGYRPYAVLFTTDAMIQTNPALVRAAVAAVKQGWASFMDDPSRVKPLIMGLNNQISPAVHDLAVTEMLATLLPHDHGKIGCMTDARWTEIAQQLRDVKFLPESFDAKQAYDLGFVPGC